MVNQRLPQRCRHRRKSYAHCNRNRRRRWLNRQPRRHRRAAVKCRLRQAQRPAAASGRCPAPWKVDQENPARPRRGINDRYPLKCRGRHLVDAHFSGADRRPRLTDDDRRRGATANQAGNGERGCANAKKFHANLTSCRFAKLRFNIVAAALGSCIQRGAAHNQQSRLLQPLT